jgi:hypothetical protein
VSRLSPDRVVASFDSASVLHAATVAALHGAAFPHLGNGALAGAAVRVGGRLPWPLLRHVYTRIGAAEGLPARRLGEVDMAAVAEAFADAYPRRRYPAVMVGSSNGAMAHLAAAMQVPWLPDTTLLPVARTGDPQRPADALRFGARVATRLLDHNPDSVLHHMHDQVQDELMVARMTYFRLKWRRTPRAYADFLSACLAPGAPVLLVEDGSRWPVVRVGERHVFQAGAQGGWEPEDYLQRPHTPQPDDEAAEAEWGADPGLGDSLARWCADHGHPLVRLRYTGPQAPAHAVASVLRRWYADRGERADRLVVPSFILGDPWRTLNAAAVPFWTFFSVQPALRALEAHLAASPPYRSVDLLLFQHGVHSAGIAYPEEWERTVARYGATPRLVGLDSSRFPHDIASLGRYGPALRDLPRARVPWSPLDVDRAVAGLRAEGVDTGPPKQAGA